VLRYWVTLLAFLAVAGIALRQNGPAPPSGVPEPVQLTDKSAIAGAHGKRRGRPGLQGRRAGTSRRSEDGRVEATASHRRSDATGTRATVPALPAPEGGSGAPVRGAPEARGGSDTDPHVGDRPQGPGSRRPDRPVDHGGGSGPGIVVAAPAPPSVGAPAVDDEAGDDESGTPTADD
jgi:hypothetical protein